LHSRIKCDAFSSFYAPANQPDLIGMAGDARSTQFVGQDMMRKQETGILGERSRERLH
jgi:hypothetical protein